MITIANKDLKRRIIEISYKHKLSHLSSCLTAVDILDEIYQEKKPEDLMVLSQGHAGLALYVILEKYLGHDAEALYLQHGVHPNRDLEHDIHCSTGSLGQGLPIALGMALANKDSAVYTLISDGECMEGSIWEALRIKDDFKVRNLQVYANLNGYSAYDTISETILMLRMRYFDPDNKIVFRTGAGIYDLPFLEGIDAHYHVMSEDEYKLALQILT